MVRVIADGPAKREHRVGVGQPVGHTVAVQQNVKIHRGVEIDLVLHLRQRVGDRDGGGLEFVARVAHHVV